MGEQLDSLRKKNSLFWRGACLQKRDGQYLMGLCQPAELSAGHNPAPLPPAKSGRPRCQLGILAGQVFSQSAHTACCVFLC